LVTKKSDWEDFAPRYIFEYKQDERCRKYLKQEATKPWDKLLLETLDRFWGLREHIWFYEPHIFAPINKSYFKAMCKQIDYTNHMNVIVMSLWFNWLNLKNPQLKTDHRSVFTMNVPLVSTIPERHLSFNDKAFQVREFREGLVNLVSIKQD